TDRASRAERRDEPFRQRVQRDRGDVQQERSSEEIRRRPPQQEQRDRAAHVEQQRQDGDGVVERGEAPQIARRLGSQRNASREDQRERQQRVAGGEHVPDEDDPDESRPVTG